jgi:hypothetical protein
MSKSGTPNSFEYRAKEVGEKKMIIEEDTFKVDVHDLSGFTTPTCRHPVDISPRKSTAF